MSTPFDIMTPAKAGFLGIVADKTLEKKRRMEALTGGAMAFPPKNTGRANFQLAWPSDPANGLLLQSDPAKNAPRGSAASWTFAVPAQREGGQWRPLQTLKLTDKDFLKVSAKVLGPRDAILLETTGHDDHETVALMGGGNLVAHHLNGPPPESSLVHDINAQGQPDETRKGGIHYTLRVRKMPRQFCAAAANNDKSTAPPEPGKLPPPNYAPMLNFTRNGDGTRADGIAHFGSSEAALSAEAGGPLTPADDGQHLLGLGEAPIHQGGIHIRRGLFGGGDAIFSPVEFINTQWEDGAKGPFTRRVEFREDFKARHANACGKPAQGMKKWMTWRDKTVPTETPPPPKDPEDDDPPPIDEPPGTPRNVFPKPDPVPPSHRLPMPGVTERPTNSGPNEEEQPSLRGLIFPNGPDAPKGMGPVAFDIFGSGDKGWREAYGITQREFWGAIRASHDVAHGVHTANTPAASGERWPLSKYKPSVFRQDENGEFYGKRGHGPAKQTLMPGGLEGHVAFKARNENLLPSAYTPTLTRLLLNYKHSSDSREVRTYFGMGAEIPSSVLPACGWYLKLDFTDGHDVPDLDFRSTDSDGLDNSTGRNVKINGTVLSGLTGNEVTAASVLADNEIPKSDGAARAVQTSGLYVDDVTGGRLPIHTANNGAGDSNDLALDVGTATGTAGDVAIGNGTAEAVSIGRAGKNSQVNGTLGVTGAATFSSTIASGAHTITQATLGNVVRTHQSTATNDDPGTTDTHNRVTTSNATATTLHTITLDTGKSYIVSAKVIGVVTTADSGEVNVVGYTVGYHLRATLRNSGGTAIIVGQTSDAQEGAGMATCACVFDATGATVRVRVTGPSNGASDTVMTWHLSELILSNPLGS